MQRPYREILEAAFKSNIPDWESVSPFDPMRVFFDSLAASLSEVEKRQNRFSAVIMDSLPGLLSFHAKSARLGQAIYKVKAYEGSKICEVEAGSCIEIEEKTGTTVARFPQAYTVQPLEEIKNEQAGHKVLISAKLYTELKGFSIRFFPEVNAESQVLRSISLRVSSRSSEKVYFRPDIETIDGTDSFRRKGEYRVILASGFLREGEEIEVVLEFENPFLGKMGLDLAQVELFKKTAEISLGRIEGLPWEEVKLPQDCAAIPEKIELRFADDRTREICRVESEVLKHRLLSPESFNKSFFYNPSTHSLIIPEADFLMEGYLNGAEVLARDVLSLVHALPAEDSQVHLDGVAGEIESVKPHSWYTPALPRESAAEYLERFYSVFRSFQTGQSEMRLFRPADLEYRVTQAIEEVRKVEVSEQGNELEVFVLHSQSESDTSKNRETVAKVVERSIPTYKSFRVYDFKKSGLSIDAKLSTEMSLDRAGIYSKELLEGELKSILQSLLSEPSVLSPERPLSQDHLKERVVERLCHAGSAVRLNPDEIAGLRFVIQNEEGAYVSEIVRAKGIEFVLSLSTQVELKVSREKMHVAI